MKQKSELTLNICNFFYQNEDEVGGGEARSPCHPGVIQPAESINISV